MAHLPVLFREVMDALRPRPGGRYLDATAGGGGHAEGLLEQSGPDGRVLATDADADAVARVRARLAPFGARATVARAWLDEAPALAAVTGHTPLDGALADLGLSSFQIDEAERGFAFMKEGPLDMRFDQDHGKPVATLLDEADAEQLAGWLRDFGEVVNARRVAEAILRARPIRTTTELRDVVAGIARADRAQRIHPATLVFQALRIAVNGELARLERALPALIDALAPGARLAVITFHSLEDRIVKQAFREAATAVETAPGFGEGRDDRSARVRLVTRKPVLPGELERRANPRARSARLRVVEKI